MALDWLFETEIDRKNRKNKGISFKRRVSITDWMPDEEAECNLGIFGGRDDQRIAVVAHAIARCYGRIGVIILHNNGNLEQGLRGFGNKYPAVVEHFANVPVCFVGNGELNYDPFNGMNKQQIIDSLYPADSMDIAMRAEAFSGYLDILQYRNIDMNLNNVVTICNMDPNEIDAHQMDGVPEYLKSGIIATMLQNNIHMQIKADVNRFARALDGHIWSSRTNPTGVNLISAVQKGAMLSVRVQDGNLVLMDYLAEELRIIAEHNCRFLLVIDSVKLGDSKLKQIIESPVAKHTTVLSGMNHMFMLADKAGENAELPISLSQKIILFSCNNAMVAHYYSDMIGNYQKQVEGFSGDMQDRKGLFNMLNDKGQYSISEQESARIRPEDLTRLGDGAVMIRQYENSGRLGADVVVTDFFDI